MSVENAINSLMDFGMTQLEAEIYIFLTRESPATGYRISQAIGKAAANVYKAIQTLENKGAIIVEEDKNRLCRAVPYDEFFDLLQRQFTERKNSTGKFLSEISTEKTDDRVYQLKTVDQVMERCRKMLARCETIAVIDAFPGVLEILKPDIETLAERGIRVAVNCYQPIDLNGVDLFETPEGQQTMERWPGQWINIVIDGNEHIIGFLNSELNKVHQAVWTGSPYISWVYYSAVFAELQLSSIKRMIQEGAGIQDLKDQIENWDELFTLEAPGYKNLVKRFGLTS